jgi:hypothetical protein
VISKRNTRKQNQRSSTIFRSYQHRRYHNYAAAVLISSSAAPSDSYLRLALPRSAWMTRAATVLYSRQSIMNHQLRSASMRSARDDHLTLILRHATLPPPPPPLPLPRPVAATPSLALPPPPPLPRPSLPPEAAAGEGGGRDIVPLGARLGGLEGRQRVGDRRSSPAVLVFASCPAAASAAPLPRVLVSTTAGATLLPSVRSGGRGPPRLHRHCAGLGCESMPGWRGSQ